MLDQILLRWNQPRAYEEARRLALRPAETPAEPPDVHGETLAQLRGNEAIRFGEIPDGRPLDVDTGIGLQTGLVIGAPGYGKTRLLLYLMRTALCWSLGQRPPGARGPARLVVHDELSDTKGETVEEMKKHVAALYLRADDVTRERLARSVRLLEWSRESVSPTAPFDNAAGTVSDAFLADLRTGIEVAVSTQTYTDSVRQALFMLNRLLIAKRFPPNYRFSQRLLNDAAYRAHVLEGVADRDVRAYFSHLEDALPNQTRDALLRRIQYGLSFPEIQLSIGVPPAALDRLLPATDPLLTLGNFGPGVSLPPSKARERASHRIVDHLLEAPRRIGQGHRRLVLEEAAAFLTTAGELVEPLANASRTHRVFNSSVVYAAQDFENALPRPLVETLTLNSAWWAVFQSRREGEWIAPYAAEAAEGAKGRAAFVEHVRALPRQHYYFYAKRGRALPAKAPDVLAPEEETRRSGDELLEIFRTRIAVTSLIPARVAAAEIERWEAETVDGFRAAAEPRRRRPPVRGIGDLLADLEGDADA